MELPETHALKVGGDKGPEAATSEREYPPLNGARLAARYNENQEKEEMPFS